MTKLLLILSFTLGLASPAFAYPTSATVIEQGKIINKEKGSYFDEDGELAYYYQLIVAYNNQLYWCRIDEKYKDVECLGYTNKPALAFD